MRGTGIIRRIDDLVSVVIPKAVRKYVFGTEDIYGKPMEIFYEKGKIILMEYKPEEANIKEEDNMSRIDKIVQFAQKREEDKLTKEQEKQRQIEDYKAKIKALKPRIDELLAVGNACLEHNIPIACRSWGGHEGYDTHHFTTNSWSHLLGFVLAGKNLPIYKLGICGGGACNYDLETDGVSIDVSGDVLYVLKRFVQEFDEFEEEFYKYIDEITK